MNYTDQTKRPQPLAPKLDSVPSEMREAKQWVMWKYIWKNDQWAKIPFRTNGVTASSTDPQTWETFNSVFVCYEQQQSRFDGIGFVFTDSEFVGIDLDECLNGKEMTPFAMRVCEKLKTYTEVSPSKTGLHLIGKAKGIEAVKTEYRGNKIEIYNTGRYFTFTGWSLQPQLEAIEVSHPLQEIINAVKPPRKEKTETVEQSQSLTLSNESRLKMALKNEKTKRWFEGDTSEHGYDDSRADMALARNLAFYCDGNRDILDWMFRQSKLMRPKWDERRGNDTYGNITLNKILETQENYASFAKVKAQQPKSDYEFRKTRRLTFDSLWDSTMAYRQSGDSRGVDCGWNNLTELYRPAKGQFTVITGLPGCQPQGSKVLLGTGEWTTVEKIKAGDVVVSPQKNGKSVNAKVLSVAKYENKPIFKISTLGRQRRSYLCSDDHIIPYFQLRATHLKGKRTYQTILKEKSVAELVGRGSQCKAKSRIFTTPPIEFPEQKLTIHPYILGCFIGDGCLTKNQDSPTFVCETLVLKQAMEEVGAVFGKITARKNKPNLHTFRAIKECASAFRQSEIWGCNSFNKFIPLQYKQGSLKQRLELLAGLIDTDGDNHSFSTVSEQLAQDFADLIFSIGGVANIKPKKSKCKGKDFNSFRVHYSVGEYQIPTRLERKRQRIRDFNWKNHRNRTFQIEEVGIGDVYGFTLDSESSWYVTDDWIVTHNSGKSTFLDVLCYNISRLHQWKFTFASFETLPMQRHILNFCQIHLQKPTFTFINGCATDNEMEEARKELNEYFHFIMPSDDELTIEGIFEYVADDIKDFGISGFVLDPYTELDEKRGYGITETEHIKQVLKYGQRFTRHNQIHWWLIAHPVKSGETYIDGRPSLRSIAGSQNFYNKVDNGLIVHRVGDTRTKVFVDKVRFDINGKQGECEFDFDSKKRSYTPIGDKWIEESEEFEQRKQWSF